MSVPSRRAAPAETGRNEPAAPSGRLLLRMPRTLHGALTEAAEREGTSLNQFITGTLASAIGWRGEGGGDARAPRARPRSEPSRALFLLLVANAVAVGLAALAAVGLLLLAWLG